MADLVIPQSAQRPFQVKFNFTEKLVPNKNNSLAIALAKVAFNILTFAIPLIAAFASDLAVNFYNWATSSPANVTVLSGADGSDPHAGSAQVDGADTSDLLAGSAGSADRTIQRRPHEEEEKQTRSRSQHQQDALRVANEFAMLEEESASSQGGARSRAMLHERHVTFRDPVSSAQHAAPALLPHAMHDVVDHVDAEVREEEIAHAPAHLPHAMHDVVDHVDAEENSEVAHAPALLPHAMHDVVDHVDAEVREEEIAHAPAHLPHAMHDVVDHVDAEVREEEIAHAAPRRRGGRLSFTAKALGSIALFAIFVGGAKAASIRGLRL